MFLHPEPTDDLIVLPEGYLLRRFRIYERFSLQVISRWEASHHHELLLCAHGRGYHHHSAASAYFCCTLDQQQRGIQLMSHCLGCFKPLTQPKWCNFCPGSYCAVCYSQAKHHTVLCQAMQIAA